VSEVHGSGDAKAIRPDASASRIANTAQRNILSKLSLYSMVVRAATAHGSSSTELGLQLAIGGGKAGSEIQTPMAIVILCGLTTSTVLNMIVVPTLYLRFGPPAQ